MAFKSIELQYHPWPANVSPSFLVFDWPLRAKVLRGIEDNNSSEWFQSRIAISPLTGKCLRPANVSDRQMSRPANVSTGRSPTGKGLNRQMSTGRCPTGRCQTGGCLYPRLFMHILSLAFWHFCSTDGVVKKQKDLVLLTKCYSWSSIFDNQGDLARIQEFTLKSNFTAPI